VERLREIMKMEGIPAEKQALLHIVEVFNNDIRQILNYFGMASRNQQCFTYLKTKDSIIKNTKDALNSLNKWQASTKLLNRAEFSRIPIPGLLDIFLIDIDMIPLMIEDSLVPSMIPKSKYTLKDMKNLAKAYDSICQSDVLS
jgi:replication factor C subunit 1